MKPLWAALCLVGVTAACHSRPLGPYVSPRVTGQVLAADTHRPLEGAKVTRGGARTDRSTGTPIKGGELLMLKAPVETDRDGRFVLASERVLSVVRGTGWNAVSLSFDRSGYRQFRTNCSTSLAPAPTNGPPVLDVGTILLEPVVSAH